MASLNRALTALATLAPLFGLLAQPVDATPQPEVAADATLAAEAFEPRVAEAEAALLEADIERAQGIAESILADLAPVAEDPSADETLRALLARALDLIAQSKHAFGDESGAIEAIDRLIALNPAFKASGEIVGPRYVEAFEARRAKLVGTLDITCAPLPCERVAVDGRERVLGAQSQLPVAAGSHEIVLIRHGFEPVTMPDVEIMAGEVVPLEVTLEQVARDVTLSTSPAGVSVYVDGRELGVTEPEEGSEVSRPFLILELAPGPHDIVLRAPCRQRVEIPVEIVLDSLDPGPLDQGLFELPPAEGVIEIGWERPEGVLLLDGSPVAPGRHAVCPGSHEVALSLAGRRAWIEAVDVEDGQVASVRPRPRPTLALVAPASSPLANAAGDAWNVLGLDEGAMEALLGPFLGRTLRAVSGGVPLYPSSARGALDVSKEALAALAPDADLIAVERPWRRGVRDAMLLVLIDPRLGAYEATTWDSSGDERRRDQEQILEVSEPDEVPFLGIDVAARRDGTAVVTGVHAASPAASRVTPGAILVSISGQAVSGPGDLDRWLSTAKPGGTTTISFRGAGGTQELEVALSAGIAPVTPDRFGEGLLLPELAAAGVERRMGDARGRLSGAIREGMILVALGLHREAAAALDAADIDESADPSQDLRGTVWRVLELEMRKLGDGAEYAEEVAARWRALSEARFGGRQGPPLRYAGRD